MVGTSPPSPAVRRRQSPPDRPLAPPPGRTTRTMPIRAAVAPARVLEGSPPPADEPGSPSSSPLNAKGQRHGKPRPPRSSPLNPKVAKIGGLLVGCLLLKRAARPLRSHLLRAASAPVVARSNSDQETDHEVVLRLDAEAQRRFQDLVRANQHPKDCSRRRILLTPAEAAKDGFTLELRDVGRYLMTAMATDRTLVLSDSWKSAYVPLDCKWNGGGADQTNVGPAVVHDWMCLHEPHTNCTSADISFLGGDMAAQVDGTPGIGPRTHHKKTPSGGRTRDLANFNRVHDVVESDGVSNPQARGIIVEMNESRYFNTKYYGAERVVIGRGWQWWRDSTQFVDKIVGWERTRGRFWIRAQIQHYLWRPSASLLAQMKERLPNIRGRYIGMHVRRSDSVGTMKRDFGRDITRLRTLDNFVEIAKRIRDETGISTLYVATDDSAVAEQLDGNYQGWTVHVQEDVRRTNSSRWMWFKRYRSSGAAAIATDVEALRRADYLIGSFQSNVYRLASELNLAYHAGRYPFTMDRHRTVDIEWYEDP